MHDFSKPELVPRGEEAANRKIYRGNSMLRLFSPGDLLAVESLSAGDVRTGDVICFDNPDGGLTVHRVVGRTADGSLVTMGDNNPRPDAFTLSPDRTVQLVRTVRGLSGRESTVHGGRRGMLIFRLNRLRRFGAGMSGIAAGALRRINPFRIPLKDPVRFGNSEVFFFHRTPVAKRVPNAGEEWLSPWFRTFFKIDGEK